MNRWPRLSRISQEKQRDHQDTRQISEEMITIDHIFRLLALVHAQEPLQIAYRALNSRDEHLRQTSLEYLEVLPYQVWHRILPLFEEGTKLASVG